jgi:hypothetical protein
MDKVLEVIIKDMIKGLGKEVINNGGDRVIGIEGDMDGDG